MDKALLKAAEDALMDAFQIGFESTKNGQKNDFVEIALTDIVCKGSLDDTLDRNMEKWDQYSSFMDVVFARGAITSTNFVGLVAKFIRE